MRTTDGGIVMRAVRLFVCAGLLAVPAWTQGANDSKDEVFEEIDPYTGGDRAGIDQADYVGLGPFPLWDGARTADIEEVIGRRVLWVETAHFKIGSTLETYKSAQGDAREVKRVKAELERLKPRFAKFRPPPGKLDPWLRLHLYAQRAEDEYANFVRDFKLRNDDFPIAGAAISDGAPLGYGPYLGQANKFVVLLLEKESHFGRVVSRWFKPTEFQSTRERMNGGGLLLAISAETLAKWEYEQDAALHSTLAADLAFNFVEGFRDRGYMTPMWWKLGLAHVAARRVDEKLAIYTMRAARTNDADAWKWEPRVLALVKNDYAPSWSESMKLETWDQVSAALHMCAWSRVTWMIESQEFDTRAWLLALARAYPDTTGEALTAARQAHELHVLTTTTGKSPEEMDTTWRQWVLRTYKK